ncbi:caskin-1-like isoform X2 [Frankliniella occidentalis]|uniref:Caskin-1-like isoform X2 n=1 Tax=Frankliniella occidentalis TaxID=133901 RepID=A0A9C6WVF5_FRAOC|nr:caskin-1-like isoform X2 [Frankliniella occidentalis]
MALSAPQLQLPHLPHSQSEPSKLCQLRARYQQRQLADKEQRLLQLYAEQRAQQERAFQRVGASQAVLQHGLHREPSALNGSAGSSSSNASQSSQSSLPHGKVRQLFEGRRHGHGASHGAGRDRGLPLAPIERRARAPVLATRSNSNVNLSQTYHFGQQQPRQPRGHSLDRDLRVHRQGDWAARGRHHQQRHLDYASDSSESDRESPPLYARTYGAYAPDQRFHEDLRGINRLPNVGGQLLSQQQQQQTQQAAMAPPGRLSAPGAGTTPASRRPPAAAANENAPPPGRPGATGASRLPGPARKTMGTGAAAPAPARVAPLRPSSGQRSAPTAAAAAAVKPAGPAQPARAPAAAARTNGVPRPAPASTKVPASPQRMASTTKAAATPPRAAAAAARPEPRQDDGLVGCPICSRRFLPDRVAKHQEICSRSTHKKRKVFDPVAARVKGTEAEKYVRRAKNAPEPKALKNNSWRRKHEDFIQTIRAAKQVQTHIANGGKLSDLPPPPPSDYSDYVQCPHCARKFNQTAADRHIPKCSTMLHNKPKPGGASKPAVGRAGANRR